MDTNTRTVLQPPSIGTPWLGGTYAGMLLINGAAHALIVAPKAEGETQDIYGEYGQEIDGAGSYCDGLANTEAMAKAGSKLGAWARGLTIGGFQDWAIPARDQLELLYRNLKPADDENSGSFRDGDNPSSLPPGYPYTDEAPAQTGVEAFKDGGAEAFGASWYWASTQDSADNAWYQYFDIGYQDWSSKHHRGRARAVRQVPLIQ